ncbi:MAG: Zn-dependent hydrolase [Flavobacteriales bacterium]|nr:Zn-dependent hydrolase [Flavobacteriales bacterium]
MKHRVLYIIAFAVLFSCGKKEKKDNTLQSTSIDSVQAMLDKYTTVRLTTDLSVLSKNYQQMIPLLIEVAQIMDDLFWEQALSIPKDEFLSGIADEKLRRYAEINYGPWDRLDGNKPFISGFGEKPKGANYYPVDMDSVEFAALADNRKKDQYTLIRRDSQGKLMVIPYNEAYKVKLEKAALLIRQAAALCEDPGLKNYLLLRAEALLTNNYQPSDLAWMDMKSNPIDFVVGPIETYEDQLYGYKAAFEAYVLVKDMEWSKKLEKYAAFLPELQKNLPVDLKYKKEMPGSDADLNAYDAIYYAGDCNSGSKTIAINLPNDEEVQLKKGTRRLQLKNVMRAKFDKILLPIAQELIDPSLIKHITFDAFFSTVMFHEVAHGLGIKNTINGKGTVREALRDHASALEEGKADILGLYMITQLHQKGEIEGALEDYYVTFLAGIFRSVRFGASSAHGKANMIRFNFFKEKGAFERDATTGKYKVNFAKMNQAMTELSRMILTLQGDGDYDGVDRLVKEKGVIGNELQVDLDRLKSKNIPVDIVFEQGKSVLGI